jgi:NAD(P)-dependent dehydrogenase (short-subunit alcohol dehydrogenase family)
MGLGTVELFVEEGARVVIADVQADKGLALEESSSPDFGQTSAQVSGWR